MAGVRVTMLIERLGLLLTTAAPDAEYPALQALFSRALSTPTDFSDPDSLRCALLGGTACTAAPVGALTRINDGSAVPAPAGYWLRADPVTLRADLARVVMVGVGANELDEAARLEIADAVREVLASEGIELHPDHPDRWTAALPQPLEFNFTPLRDALGRDIGEVLPQHPQALRWHRLLNEIQMALHACPVNQHRRERGRYEINSVWFWGGGSVPAITAPARYDAIYADHPVTRGLARLHDIEAHALAGWSSADFSRSGATILIDRGPLQAPPETELAGLEQSAGILLEQVRRHDLQLDLYGAERRWRLDRRSLRRFWKRPRRLGAIAAEVRT